MSRVLAEEARRDAFDAEFSAELPGPYDIVQELVRPDAVPYLVEVLDPHNSPGGWR